MFYVYVTSSLFVLDHVRSHEISGLEDEILDEWWDRIMTCAVC